MCVAELKSRLILGRAIGKCDAPLVFTYVHQNPTEDQRHRSVSEPWPSISKAMCPISSPAKARAQTKPLHPSYCINPHREHGM